TGTIRAPRPWQNPFAAAIPTLRPVKEPGPADTATWDTSESVDPAFRKSPSTAASIVPDACRPAGSRARESTFSPETSATPPCGVAVSIARINGCYRATRRAMSL
ncbi:MAG: hypothetical protein HW408_1218, partial [Actinobacteria bacterium]|nr:hypothetical protein [Actinomycetota bacterium]